MARPRVRVEKTAENVTIYLTDGDEKRCRIRASVLFYGDVLHLQVDHAAEGVEVESGVFEYPGTIANLPAWEKAKP